MRLRNVVLITGLLTIYALIAGVLGLAWNVIGTWYGASGNWPGSTVLLFLVSSIGHYISAAVVGILAAMVLESPRKSRWVAALALLAGVFALGGWSFGWNWQHLDWEGRLGWIGQAVLTAAAVVGGFALKHRATLSR